MPTFGADKRRAYKQVWLEVRRPYAGVTAPEWNYDLKAGGTVFQQALTATASTTATMQRQVKKILSATEGNTASFQKQVNKILSLAESSAATMQRQTNKILSTTAGSTATMIAGKVWALTLSATSSTVATMSAVFQSGSAIVARLRAMMGVGT